MASEMDVRRTGKLFASWAAIVVKNMREWLTSFLPRVKKKLAASRFFSASSRAIVREIVDLPVPAIPFSQKMHLPFGSSHQSIICLRRSTRVSCKQ